MRTKATVIALAALGLATTQGGCSLVYNPSHYQGGTRNDGGVGLDTGGGTDDGGPTDAGTDTGADGGGSDAGSSCTTGADCTVMNTYCDTTSMTCVAGCDEDGDCTTANPACNTTTHVCGPASCTTSSMCMGDTYCHLVSGVGACAPCDGDGDHYYAEDAGVGCARLTHLNGGDCDDTNAAIYPTARADCSTAFAESCPIGVAFTVDPTITVQEMGLSPENVVFADGGGFIAPRGGVWVAAGDEAPLLPTSGTGDGFVGFIGSAMDGTSRFVYGAPLVLDGAAGAPEKIFGEFQVQNASFAHTRDSTTGRETIVLSAMETPGLGGHMGMMLGPMDHGGLNWSAPSTATYATPPFFAGGMPNIGAIETVGVPALAGFLTGATSGENPSLIAGTAAEVRRTGPANVVGGTWIASAGTAAIYIAESNTSGGVTTARLGIWNGAEVNVSPPLINLDSLAGASPVMVLSPNFRGDLAVRDIGGEQYFVAVVPVAATTTPPQGRLAIVRWHWPRPAMGDATSPHLSTVTVHELDLGTARRINGYAGAAVEIFSDTDAFVAYQDASGIVMRQIGVLPATGTTVENPPTIQMIHQGSGETFVGVDLGSGLYPASASTGTGRIVVAAMAEHGTGGSVHEIRVRAIEACVSF